MASDLYKSIIDKFLSGLKIIPTKADETINKPENEASVLNEELTGAISGNKMYGDIPGLQVEEDEPIYQAEEIFPEINENNTTDPLESIEIIFFYIMNRDIVSEMASYPHSTTKTHNKFKTIEEAAIYLLQQQNIEDSEDDVEKIVKVLTMLNSNGYETTINQKINNALENINNGSINYVVYNEAKKENMPQDARGQRFYKNIGLSGEVCSLAETVSLDDILLTDRTQNDIYSRMPGLKELRGKGDDAFGNIDSLYTFETFFETLNILSQLPLTTNRPIQAGVKTVNNMFTSGKEITGAELLEMFYSTQDSVIKSGIGQFNGLYESKSDINDNNILCLIDSTIKNDNTDKSFSNIMLMNLRLLLSFESAKAIMKQQIADKFENYGSKNEIETLLDNFDTLKNISFQAVNGDGDNLEYVVKYCGETFNVNTIGEIIAISLSLMSSEVNLKQENIKSQNLSNKSDNLTKISNADELTYDVNSIKIDVDKIKALLFQGGVKFNNKFTGKLFDDGTFICDADNKYIIEFSAKDSSNKNLIRVYSNDGYLQQEKIEYTNEDGKPIKRIENTNQKEALAKYPQALSVKKTSFLRNGVTVYEYSYPENFEYTKMIVIANDKMGEETVISVNESGAATDNKGYMVNIDKVLQNIETQNKDCDSVEAMKNQRVSDKSFYNKETGKVTEINKDRMKTEIQGNENSGCIKLYDENKYLLGELLYKQSNDGKDINIYSFNTQVKDDEINIKLIEEVLKLAEKYNKSVITTYQDKFNSDEDAENYDLKFYYKMGFQAEDSGIDKLIRRCLTKNICVPESIAKYVVLRYINDITPSKQISTVSIQKMHRELETFFNNDSYLINVEYKYLFENLGKLDYENINLHLDNIKKCIDNNVDGNNLKTAIDYGYFSSSKGAEAFETFYNKFTENGPGHSSAQLNIILTHFEVKNFENAKKRGLIEKLNVNNVKQINTLAKYTDRQYNQMLKFVDMGIEYISDNDDINRLAIKYVKDKTGNSYSQEDIEKIILQVKDSQKITDIVNELIKADNSVVINLLTYTKDPKFIASNLNNFVVLDAKLHASAKYVEISRDFASGFYDYKGLSEKIYSDKGIASIMFDIDISGKYTDEQLYGIGARINNTNKDFVKKLALSDAASPDEVMKILNDTRFLTIMCEHNSELSTSQKLESYNLLLSMPEHLRSICKDCGLDTDFEINKLQEQLEPKFDAMKITNTAKKAFIKNIMTNDDKVYKAFEEFDFAQYGKTGLPLKYTREDFVKNVEQILFGATEEEQTEVLKHFGLTKGVMEGFDGVPNNKPFESKDKKLTEIAEKVQKEIENYTMKNEVLIQDIETKKVLDIIMQGIPEFTMFIGKKQHGEHAYSVDIHTLKVLQSAMKDPLYSELSDSDKAVLKLAILMHDFGKKGGVVDTEHASMSVDYANVILNKLNISEDIRCRTLDAIKYHHWFADFNTGKTDADDVLFMCKNEKDLNIYKIFAKADFSNVNPIFRYYKTGTKNSDEFEEYMAKRFNKINKARKKII